jgi:hypothetical protein
MALAPDRQGPVNHGHAGPLARHAIHFNQAILAHTHAAKDAAFRRAARDTKTADAVRSQRRRHAFAGAGLNWLTFKLDHKTAHHRSSVRPEPGVSP